MHKRVTVVCVCLLPFYTSGGSRQVRGRESIRISSFTTSKKRKNIVSMVIVLLSYVSLAILDNGSNSSCVSFFKGVVVHRPFFCASTRNGFGCCHESLWNLPLPLPAFLTAGWWSWATPVQLPVWVMGRTWYPCRCGWWQLVPLLWYLCLWQWVW